MKLPYIAVYVNDYIADTTRLRATANGAYWFLLLEYWRLRGSIPNDRQWLIDTARVTEKEWDKIAYQVLSYFAVEGDRLVHARMEADLEKARDKSRKAKEAADAKNH